MGAKTALSRFIESHMRALGMDKSGLVRKSGLSRATIYGYLDGRNRGIRPRPGTFEALAAALEVDVSEIYFVAAKADAQGLHRLTEYYLKLPNDKVRAEAIEAVRRLGLRRSKE